MPNGHAIHTSPRPFPNKPISTPPLTSPSPLCLGGTPTWCFKKIGWEFSIVNFIPLPPSHHIRQHNRIQKIRPKNTHEEGKERGKRRWLMHWSWQQRMETWGRWRSWWKKRRPPSTLQMNSETLPSTLLWLRDALVRTSLLSSSFPLSHITYEYEYW